MVGGGEQQMMPMNAVMKPILLLTFMDLQILDVLSTDLVLAHGGWEANPLSVGDSELWRVVVAAQAGARARLHLRDDPLAGALHRASGGADGHRRQQFDSVKEGGGACGPPTFVCSRGPPARASNGRRGRRRAR